MIQAVGTSILQKTPASPSTKITESFAFSTSRFLKQVSIIIMTVNAKTWEQWKKKQSVF